MSEDPLLSCALVWVGAVGLIGALAVHYITQFGIIPTHLFGWNILIIYAVAAVFALPLICLMWIEDDGR